MRLETWVAQVLSHHKECVFSHRVGAAGWCPGRASDEVWERSWGGHGAVLAGAGGWAGPWPRAGMPPALRRVLLWLLSPSAAGAGVPVPAAVARSPRLALAEGRHSWQRTPLG